MSEGLRQQPLALGGCLKLSPNHVCQQPPAAARTPVIGEQGGDVIQKRRGDHDVAVFVRAAIAEHHTLGRARDARVQQVPLAVQRIARLWQRQPGAERELAASVVAEERVGDGGLRARELVLTQSCHEYAPEAPGADRERLGDQHRPRRRRAVRGHLQSLEHFDQLAPGSALIAELLQLLECRNTGGGPRIQLLGGAEHRTQLRGAAPPATFACFRPGQRRVGREPQLLDASQAHRPTDFPQRASPPRLCLLSADLALERSTAAGVRHAGAAQVGDQIIDLALRAGQQRVPRQPQQRTAERRVPERNPASARSRHS